MTRLSHLYIFAPILSAFEVYQIDHRGAHWGWDTVKGFLIYCG